jgi:hypothetical protein
MARKKPWKEWLNRSLTLVVMPHTSAQSLHIKIALWQILMFVLLVGALGLSGLTVLVQNHQQARLIEGYRQVMVAQREEKLALEETQRALQEQMLMMAAQTAELYGQLAQLNLMSQEVWALMEENRGFVGQRLSGPELGGPVEGVHPVRLLGESLAYLQQMIPQQGKELSSLRADVLAYQHRREHTPDIWPVNGRVTSTYGWRRHPLRRVRHLHTGIDIGTPYGTPVRASAAGLVTCAGWRPGYGYTVIISHGYGLETLYAHNSRLLVEAGQRVVKGQIIGAVGNTGDSTGPHLHYEVIDGGRAVNPQAYLPMMDGVMDDVGPRAK